MSKSQENKLLIVDGHAMVFRAWFSIPERLNSNQTDTRGAYGFINTLLKTIRENDISHVSVCFDTKAPTFRDKIFPEYKAQRPPVDPNLHKQIPIAKDLLSSMNIPVFEQDGFEADDLVGTLSSIADKNKLQCLILTGDADQLQLVNSNTNVLMYSGFGEIKTYDNKAVKERYDGLGPEFVAEIKALEGDPSDNIPGVPGIGKKAARTLLLNFGHFENLFENTANIEKITNLRGAKRVQNLLVDNKEIAIQGLSLTNIVRDVVLDWNLNECEFGNFDIEKITKTFEHYELKTSLNNFKNTIKYIETSIDQNKNNTPNIEKHYDKFVLVNDNESFINMYEELIKSDHFSFDTETTGLNTLEDEIIGISFCNSIKISWYVVLKHENEKIIFNDYHYKKIKELFENEKISKSAHNANFDIMVLKNYGINVVNLNFDTMIAAALCAKSSLSLKNLSEEILNISMTKITDLIGTGKNQKTLNEVSLIDVYKYAAADSYITYKLREFFLTDLKKYNQEKLFYELEIPLMYLN